MASADPKRILHALPVESGRAVHNMAVDRAMLDWAEIHHRALLRVYQWSEPAWTFGYSQKISPIEAEQPRGLQLVRRLSGGGIVDHRTDLTYALVLPASFSETRLPALTFYRRWHEILQTVLAPHLPDLSLAACPGNGLANTRVVADRCFPRPAPFDLVTGGRQKVAGAALKRNRCGLLVQGSLQLPRDLALPPESFLASLQAEAARRLPAEPLGGPVQLEPERIEKWEAFFSDPDWNRRR